MATAYTLTIDGVAYTSRMILSEVHIRSLVGGVGYASFILENNDGGLVAIEDFSCKQKVVIYTINTVEHFRGYLFTVNHYSGDQTVLRYFGNRTVTELTCLDYGYDLTKKRLDLSEATINAKDAMTLAVANAEVTYAAAGGPAVGPLEFRKDLDIEIVKEICERADYDAYVPSIGGVKALEFFAIGTVASGITVANTDIVQVNMLEASLEDLANKVYVYGKPVQILPANEDQWTDGATEDDAGPYSTSAPAPEVYEQLWSFAVDPSATQYANCWFLTFDYDVTGTDFLSATVKATFTVTGGDGETLITGGANAGEINYAVAGAALMECWPQVPSDSGFAANATVTVKIYGKVDLGGGGTGDEIATITNISLGYTRSEGGWDGTLNQLTLCDNPRVFGGFCMKYTATTIQAINAAFISFPAIAFPAKYSEYNYRSLKFVLYVSCDKAIDYLEVRVITTANAANYFYRRFPVTLDAWRDYSVSLGVNQNWTVATASADWDDVRGLRLYLRSTDANATWTVYTDHLRFDEKPYDYDTTDAGSVADYLRCDSVEYLNESTLAEITAKGTSILAKLHDPFKSLDLVVDGTLGVVGGVMKWLPGNTLTVTCTVFDLAAVVYRMLEITLICNPKTDVVPGHDFIAKVHCVPYDKPVMSNR